MGGAPPPPQDFAPEGSKNRRNSAPEGRILEVCRPRGSRSESGGWGDPGHYPISERRGWVWAPTPTRRDSPQGEDQGIGLGGGLSRPGRSPPNPAGIRQRHRPGPVRRWTCQRPEMGKRADCRTKSALHPARFAWVAYAPQAMGRRSATSPKQMRRRSRYVATSTLCLEQAPMHSRAACYAWKSDRCSGSTR